MATLQTLECSGCGMIIGLDQLDECPRCHKKNFLKKGVDPLQLDNGKISEYISFFKNKVASNPKDTNSLFAMGLFYLKLRNFELAQRNFKQAVDLSPMEPDMYYYYAISLIAGRAPKQLNHEEAKCIRQWAQTALRMDAKRKYLMLLAFIEQGAFVANGLQAERQPDALVEEALKILPEANEMEEIASYVRLTDEKNKKYFEQLSTGKKEEGASFNKSHSLNSRICPICGNSLFPADLKWGEMKCHNCNKKFPGPALCVSMCSYPSSRDSQFTEEGAAALCEKPSWFRDAFFRHLHEPKKPQEIKKPFWPIGKSLLGLVLALFATIVTTVIAAIIGGDAEREFKEVYSVQQEYTELYGNKGYGPKKRQQVMAELRADSILEAQKDSAFLANTFLKGGAYESGEWISMKHLEEAQRPYKIFGFEKSWKGVLFLVLVFLPLLVWITRTVIRMISCSRERLSIAKVNKERAEQYASDMEAYHARPTVEDYVFFCAEFLGQGKVVGEGDLVKQALKEVDVDEHSLPSKILFLNYFEYETESGERTWRPENVLARIYYVIAIPQEEKLTIFKNSWDTKKDRVDSCDYSSLLYRNINSIRKDDDVLLINMVGGEEIDIVLPSNGRSSVLHYQGDYPKYASTYSTTRTGNVGEFINSLEKLVSNFQKKR